jgi:hypothetical protein
MKIHDVLTFESSLAIIWHNIFINYINNIMLETNTLLGHLRTVHKMKTFYWKIMSLQPYVSYVALDHISISFWLVSYDFCFAYGYLKFRQCFAHFWLISMSFLLLSPNTDIWLMPILCIFNSIVHLTFVILFSIVLL